MPNWKEILNEILETGGPHDVIRRKYLFKLHKKTGRNIIAYYSGWQQKQEVVHYTQLSIDDSDQNGFMSTIHKLDRAIGLDLILHTPGGSIAATDGLVRYLRSMFGQNIRAIIPHMAMSAGTMMALSCKSILMGKQSHLGPIDPQVGGKPAHGVIEEFKKAREEIAQDNNNIYIWQPIISHYNPTFIGECEKAITWTNEIVKEWLKTCMFAEDKKNASKKASKIVSFFSDHELTKAHDRHIDINLAEKQGVEVNKLEDDDELQDLVLSVHHAFIHTLSSTDAYKIIENHKGVAFIQNLRMIPA